MIPQTTHNRHVSVWWKGSPLVLSFEPVASNLEPAPDQRFRNGSAHVCHRPRSAAVSGGCLFVECDDEVPLRGKCGIRDAGLIECVELSGPRRAQHLADAVGAQPGVIGKRLSFCRPPIRRMTGPMPASMDSPISPRDSPRPTIHRVEPVCGGFGPDPPPRVEACTFRTRSGRVRT